MKKGFLMFLVFALVFSLVPGFGLAAKSTVNERVIVLFKEKVDKNVVSEARGKINREYHNVPALAISVPSTAIRGLQNNPNVLTVEKDEVVEVSKQTQDWGIERSEAPKAWENGYTGKGVRVAVVDTGVANHEDLVIAGGASFTSYTSSFSDDNGHGTHVAGIIGARNNTYGTVGIAHEASIYAVKVLDGNGSGYLSDVIAGIDWSITNKMDIINLSLGTTTHSSTLKQVVDQAYNQGILVVGAAGNNGSSDGTGDTVNYPARYDSVIAVSATDSKDRRASFSATGSTVEVAAPGVNVLSTVPGNKYAQMSGTSMAAPYVAGNLALLKQTYPELSHAQLRVKLQENVIDLGEEGKDNWFGYGLIQAPVKNADQEPVQEPIQEPVQETEESLTPLEQATIDVEIAEFYRTWDYVNIAQDSIDALGNGRPVRADKQSLQERLDVVKNELNSSVNEPSPTEPTPSEPVEEEPVNLVETVTNVETNKSVYSAGESVTITVKVTDKIGNVVSGADVIVEITPPRGRVLTANGQTNNQGIVTVVMSTNRNAAKGTYEVKAETSKTDFKGSSSTTTFQIR